jgi:hypothetical protein
VFHRVLRTPWFGPGTRGGLATGEVDEAAAVDASFADADEDAGAEADADTDTGEGKAASADADAGMDRGMPADVIADT